MPPSNTTPETALVISALPYDITIDPVGAPDSTLLPQCNNGVHDDNNEALWWKYTPPVNISVLGLQYHPAILNLDYLPILSIWVGTPPALTQLVNRCFFFDTDGIGYVSTNVTPGIAHYIQIASESGIVPTTTDLVLHVEAYPNVPAPPGSLVVSNDFEGFPLAVILRDGTLAQLLGRAPFEQAEWLPSGQLAVIAETEDGGEAVALKFFDHLLNFVTDVPGAIGPGLANLFSPITSNHVDTFYVVDEQLSPASAFLKTITAAGVVTTGHDMRVEIGEIGGGIGLSPDSTILYLIVTVGGFNAGSIGRWDLINNVPLTPLVTFSPGTLRPGNDLPVMADGSVLIPVVNQSGTKHWNVRRYAADGTLLNTYLSDTQGIGQTPRLRRDFDDPTVFWSMVWPTGHTGGETFYIQKIRLSDGAILETVAQIVKEGGGADAPMYGVSSSCPLLLTPLTMEVPAAPAPCIPGSVLQTRRSSLPSPTRLSAATNLTPATALEITSLPYSATLDVSAAPTGSGYPSTCDSAQRNAVWFKYTAKPWDTYLSFTAYPSNLGEPTGTYDPSTSIWTGTPPALTQFQIRGPGTDDQDYCDNLWEDFWFMVPVVVGTTYYFQIVNDDTNPPDSTLTVKLQGQAIEEIPAGSIVITDDSDGYPAGVVSPTDGSFLRWVPLPAGETAATLQTGEICLQGNEANNDTVAIYSPTLALVGIVSIAPYFVGGISSNQHDTFYVYGSTYSGDARRLFALNAAGTILAQWAMPAPPSPLGFNGTPNREGTIYYSAGSSTGAAINAYDLVNAVALPDLHAGYPGEIICGYGCGFVDPAGIIWFVYFKAGIFPAPAVNHLRGFNAAGVEVSSYLLDYTIDVNQRVNRYCGALDADDAIWLWWQSGNSRFDKIALSDGHRIIRLGPVPTNGQSGAAFDLGGYSLSNSCPIFVLPIAQTVLICPEDVARLTQLPLVAAYPYPMVAPLATGNGIDWVTPPPQRSRRGR